METVADAAILVDASDVAQIADAMWLVLTQPALAAELRARGLARAAQCTWQRTARETIAVYERVLGAEDGGRKTADGRRKTTDGGQWSAVSGQRSVVGGQQSAVGGEIETRGRLMYD